MASSHLEAALGAEVLKKIQASRVLVIGAGGIGCELLKNLVLTGFLDLEVIDLDTIDVSNLNRQFLFRPHHVGQPKALVAAEAVRGFNPSAKVVAYHANVTEQRFGLQYFKQFNLVMSALDNVAARRHVNRLCLAADIPLVEAGTAGYLGQAYVIRKKVTECFECTAKPTQAKFPICTIRSTPEKPVHCVVWAKELHKLLFGDRKNSYLYEENSRRVEPEPEGGASAEASSSSSAAAAAEPAQRDESVYMKAVSSPPPPIEAAAVRVWARTVFQAMFHDEIVKRLEMAPETYKTAKFMPKPVDLAAAESSASSSTSSSSSSSSAGHSAAALPDQRVLTLAESVALFLDALAAYYTDPAAREAMVAGTGIEFSKDEPRDLDFVTAATNVRAYTFGIPCQSRFDVKSIAGNIIAAIASTNAIVAGLEVTEAIKIIRGDDILSSCRYTWVNRHPSIGGGKLLEPMKLGKPNADCLACGSAKLTLYIDTHAATLRDMMEKVLRGQLSISRPEINSSGGFDFRDTWVEDEDGEEVPWRARITQLLDTKLADLPGGGLSDDTSVTVSDVYLNSLSIDVHFVHRDLSEMDEKRFPQGYELSGDMGPAPAPAPVPAAAIAGVKRSREEAGVDEPEPTTAAEAADDDLEIIE